MKFYLIKTKSLIILKLNFRQTQQCTSLVLKNSFSKRILCFSERETEKEREGGITLEIDAFYNSQNHLFNFSFLAVWSVLYDWHFEALNLAMKICLQKMNITIFLKSNIKTALKAEFDFAFRCFQKVSEHSNFKNLIVDLSMAVTKEFSGKTQTLHFYRITQCFIFWCEQ